MIPLYQPQCVAKWNIAVTKNRKLIMAWNMARLYHVSWLLPCPAICNSIPEQADKTYAIIKIQSITRSFFIHSRFYTVLQRSLFRSGADDNKCKEMEFNDDFWSVTGKQELCRDKRLCNVVEPAVLYRGILSVILHTAVASVLYSG